MNDIKAIGVGGSGSKGSGIGDRHRRCTRVVKVRVQKRGGMK